MLRKEHTPTGLRPIREVRLVRHEQYTDLFPTLYDLVEFTLKQTGATFILANAQSMILKQEYMKNQRITPLHESNKSSIYEDLLNKMIKLF